MLRLERFAAFRGRGHVRAAVMLRAGADLLQLTARLPESVASCPGLTSNHLHSQSQL